MQDRFKFKAVLHQNKYEEYQLEKFSHQRVFDVMSINLGIEYSTIEIIAEYPNGDWAVREIDDKDIDLIQCTGLKDKNGKLLYVGDIVKEKWFSEDSEQYEECLYVAEFSQEHCAYCLTEVSNGYKNFFVDLEYIPEDYEIIGNIYENPDLLEA